MLLLKEICEPVTALLRLADGDAPCISKIYPRMYEMQQFFKAVSGDEASIQQIRKQRRAIYKAKQIEDAGPPSARTRARMRESSWADSESDDEDDPQLQAYLHIPKLRKTEEGDKLVAACVSRYVFQIHWFILFLHLVT